MRLLRKISAISLKTVISIILIAVLAVIITSVSPIYRFKAPEPFSGPDVFNPYRNLDTAICWKRANFHTHTKVEGLLNECAHTPEEVHQALSDFGYDIVTFSNHNALTDHPFDSALQVNVYEHGYNLFKYHKLVFGCKDVNHFDHLVPFMPSQKQFQLDLLSKESDFITMNHPLRTRGTSKELMERINGYELIELDGINTEQEYWDWALSAGHYSFALSNDDLHYPDRSHCIAVRCNFLCCPSGSYEDIKNTLLEGCSYAMRVPDYGCGDWETKLQGNKELPAIKNIGLCDSTIYISLTQKADSIRVIGQNHTTLALATQCDSLNYTLKHSDPYARITAYFPKGEVIYTNAFARYDASISAGPFNEGDHEINFVLTILFNLMLLLLAAGDITLLYTLFKK
ncbi:MAG: hypothetical protein IKW11_03865 [Bacteroidales bacterium]|nr:hypothetical protein [Bacteroidales bacterium]